MKFIENSDKPVNKLSPSSSLHDLNLNFEKLKLKSSEKYEERLTSLNVENFKSNEEIWNKFGQFDYQIEKYLEEYLTVPVETSKYMHKFEHNKNGNRWYYIGTYIKDTTIRHGIGITVWDHGEIHEGYYK